MRNKFSKIVFLAGFGLALAFTFSCSSDDGDKTGDGGSSSSVAGGVGGSSSSKTQNSSSSNPVSSSSSFSSSNLSSSNVEYVGGSCDIADYGTAEIGGQVWMAKNWGCYVSGSKCYNNDPANCEKYGRLYGWSMAMGLPSKCNNIKSTDDEDCAINIPHQGICPAGWHIPSDAEWTALADYVNTNTKLKATSGWTSGELTYGGGIVSGNGTDNFGFAALPGGTYSGSRGFEVAGDEGYWWTATEYYAGTAYYRTMYWGNDGVKSGSGYKTFLQSVRCLQDD